VCVALVFERGGGYLHRLAVLGWGVGWGWGWGCIHPAHPYAPPRVTQRALARTATSSILLIKLCFPRAMRAVPCACLPPTSHVPLLPCCCCLVWLLKLTHRTAALGAALHTLACLLRSHDSDALSTLPLGSQHWGLFYGPLMAWVVFLAQSKTTARVCALYHSIRGCTLPHAACTPMCNSSDEQDEREKELRYSLHAEQNPNSLTI